MSSQKAPNNNVFYRNQNWHYPKVTHGKGIYLYEDSGKEYIDGCCGSAVANIGHGNEEIAEKAGKQAAKIAFTHLSVFTSDEIEECASKIAKLAPGDLNHVYFISGGSEAVECAGKLARQYFIERDKGVTRKWNIISRWNSFHGNTLGALSLTGITSRRNIYDPLLKNFTKINQAYCYRCPYGSTYPQCGVACAHELEKTINHIGADNVMAFIAEPVIGSAAPGANPPKEYFKIIREICDRHDVLLIIDEVMSGFGRTGKPFAIEHYGIVPDIMTIAKGMSCGYTPLGATIVSDKVFNTIMMEGSGDFIHGHTYGGNPMSAGIANTVLDICIREKYFDNAAKVGEYLGKKLQEMYKYPIVGDVRGKGLMWGIEFVKDTKTKEPFDANVNVRKWIKQYCLNHGLVIYPGGGSVDGKRGDHILIAPPINITKDEVDKLCERLALGIEDTIKHISK